MVGAPAVTDDSAGTDHRLYARRDVRPIGVLVHTTAGVSSLRYLQGGVLAEGRVASADALIDRDGTIHVLVPFDCHSYHAGDARYIGPDGIAITNINQRFIGVELEATVMQWCTPSQYVSLAGIILNKADVYHWQRPYCILGHYEVAIPLGRRSDPVNFDWGRLSDELVNQSTQQWWKG